MGKILFWLVVGFLFWFVVRMILAKTRKPETAESEEKSKDESKDKPPQITMAQCAYCGIHFSSSEAITAEDGRVFCSPPHKEAAHRAHPS